MEGTHTKQEIYSDAVFEMVHEIFGDKGLVVLNMNHQKLKSQFVPVIKEEIIKQTVTKPPYSISVTERDIDHFARDIAQGKNKTITEDEFREWYRQQLNESSLSEAEFRDQSPLTSYLHALPYAPCSIP